MGMTQERLAALSFTEIEAYRSRVAEDFKTRISDAKHLYLQHGLGQDLQVSVSGAQYLSDVHSYARTDAEVYRAKLGLGLQLPQWVKDERAGFGRAEQPEDAAEDPMQASHRVNEGDGMRLLARVGTARGGVMGAAAAGASAAPASRGATAALV